MRDIPRSFSYPEEEITPCPCLVRMNLPRYPAGWFREMRSGNVNPARDMALLTPGEQKMFRQDFPPFPAQIRRFMRVGDDLF